MRTNEHLVLCGGVEDPQVASGRTHRLDLHGGSPNVHLQISDISGPLVANVPDVLADLLEVASYVYAADSAIPRGGEVDTQMGRRWRRKFRFKIPVRLPSLWSSDPVLSALVETLSFLSDDSYEFEFRALIDAPAMAKYAEFKDKEETAFTPDEVILFSGGLDSLSGAVEELVGSSKKVALVSHRSASKIVGAQKGLVDKLRRRFGTNRVFHVPVWADLVGNPSNEPTHRTRSFLFAALGVVTARMFGRDSIRFFENGEVSLNLPPVAQVVGARATRTTHPQTLAGFQRLFSAVLDRDFGVDNPFAWVTKTEVIERIAANGCSDLIRDTRSCTRVRAMTKLHPHCGQCSQCIDRRFAVLAAGQEHEDPAEAYKVDLFTDKRPAGPGREMVLGYVRPATMVSGMEDTAFFARYGEASRVVRQFSEPADVVAERIFDLYRRHASAVCRVFDGAIASHPEALRQGDLPADSLLPLVFVQYQGGAPCHVLSEMPQQLAVGRVEIRIAIDEEEQSVVFDGWGEVKGVGAGLIIALVEPFWQAILDRISPERHPFTESGELCRKTGCDNEETLRRRVLRCRNRIKKLAKAAGDPPPSIESVIENIPRRSYRLNPDRVRILALTEVRRST